VGRDLFLRGLVSSHSGNLSLRRGQRLTITRHGCQLGHLGKGDLVETGVEADLSSSQQPSMELARHRTIYRATPARAIIHAHPPAAIALSLLVGEIVPRDVEGAYLLGRVPVLAAQEGDRLGQELGAHPIVVLRSHGSFAVGDSLETALQWTTALEESCRILLWLRLLGNNK